MNKLAPIILFVYNRLEHTQRTIESLRNIELASESELYIFSDGAKNELDAGKVSAVRNYLKTLKSFKSITIDEKDINLGLANSVIQGVGKILNVFDKAVVLEDDLIFSNNFLSFMNAALNKFQTVNNVFSVSGYNFPIILPDDYKHDVYFALRASSWGWGTWKDRWDKADWNVSDFHSFINNKSSVKDFNKGGNDLTRMLKNQADGKIDSWAIRWTYTHFKNRAYCVYPVKSKVQNIGTDSSGLHSITTNKFMVELDSSNQSPDLNINITTDERILSAFRKFFKFTLWERIYWRVKRNFKVKNR